MHEANFDERAYLILNPDVAAAVRTGTITSGRAHWEQCGHREGRLTSLPPSRPEFDEAEYLQWNPDVAYAIRGGAFASGYEHWVARGQYEGRHGGPARVSITREARLARARHNPFGVNYYGFHSAVSGLGSATRGYVEALRSRLIRQLDVDIPRWGAHFPTDEEIVHTDLRYRINFIHQNADMMPHFVKKYGRQVFEGAYNIGIWVWELNCAHPEWHRASTYLDEIWAPTVFCRDALAGVSAVPVLRMPYVVPAMDNLARHGREHFGIPRDAFVFLYIFDVSSYIERKNPATLVLAFRRAFGNSSKALLVLKYINGGTSPLAIECLRKIAADSHVRFIDADFSEEELASLHLQADCFVSPHRAEGFGFNIAQALYFGKPVIATGYSGNMDFTTDRSAFLIDYTLSRIPFTMGPYSEHMAWAEPSVAHLEALLRTVMENREIGRRKGEEGAKIVRREYSLAAVSSRIERRFADLCFSGRRARRSLRAVGAAIYRMSPGIVARAARIINAA